MNVLKKLSFILIIVMIVGGVIFTRKTYATINCSVDLSASKKEVAYGEEFSIYVRMSNLQSSKGVIAIGGILNYDKKCLTLVEIEGENKWSDPMYNDSTGRLISVKSKFATSDENVFKIRFKVNTKTGKNTTVKISNFEISDGNEEKDAGGNSVTVTVKEKSTGNNTNGQNNSTAKPSEKEDTNTKKDETPKSENSINENTEKNTIQENENEEKDEDIIGIIKDDEEDENTQTMKENEIPEENKKSWVDYAIYTCGGAVGVGAVAYIGTHMKNMKKKKRRRR